MSLITVAGRLYLVAAGVGMLVLSHIGTVGPCDVEEIRRHYAGRIAVGEDLARF